MLYAAPNAVPFYSKCGFVDFEKDMLQNQDRFPDGCTPMYTDIIISIDLKMQKIYNSIRS